MKFLRRANKVFAVITSILMLVQPVLPVLPLFLTTTVYAQETTPSVTPVPTPDPTATADPTPTETVTVAPTPDATPTAEVTPTDMPVVTETPTPDVTPTDIVTPPATETPNTTTTEPPKETGPPAEQGQILDGASIAATPSPTITPEPTEDGQLQAVVLQNVEAVSLNLDNIDPSNSATLTTDKADYAPTDTALITGSGFTAGEIYKLTISSNDAPATSTTVDVTADTNGAFVYAYQLDGTYRPNYKVEVKALNGVSIDIVTFTDGDTGYYAANQTITSNSVSNPDNGWASDNARATFNNSSDTADYGFPNLNIPAGASIDGIEVTIEGQGAGRNLTASLWNISNSNPDAYTTAKTATLSGSDTTQTLGGATDKWGRTWVVSDFADADFKIRVGATSGSNDALLDQIVVKVYYTPLPQPDLTVTKANNVGGTVNVGNPFTWTIRVTNSGTANAAFANNDVILDDNMPSSPSINNYDAPVITSSGTMGTVACAQTNTNGRHLTCSASGAITMPASSYFEFAIVGHPTATGTLINPRSGSTCSIDPDNHISNESNEGNNTCPSNSITVAAAPTPTPSPTPTPTANPTPTPTPTGTPSGVQTTIGQCVQDAYGSNVQCTANDVSIANVTNVQILDDGCISPTDTVTFKATWNVQSTATERYNIGLYFASQGQLSALTGTCAVSTLANSPVPPNYNFDGNACGDISSAGSVNPEITMTVQCKDPDGDNTLNLPYCTSWNQNVGENLSCSTPSNAIPGAPSKCNCQDGFEVPVTVPHFAKIEVKKSLNPTNDAGTFNLQVDGTNGASCVGNNGTTGSVDVTAGTSANPGAAHTVGETIIGCGSTSLSNYTSSLSCVNRGTTTYHNGAALTANGTGPLNVGVVKDDDVVCTVTNTRNQGTLRVIKTVINDNGGTTQAQDFSFQVNSGSATAFEADGQNDLVVSPGTYSVTEPSVSGYATTYSNCSNVEVTSGGTTTCTVTNNDIAPQLTVIKHVINDNGGSAVAGAFTMNVTGTNVSNASFAGSETGTIVTLGAGSYSVDENAFTGYTKSLGANCSGTIAVGQSKSCTVTNDDQAATLIVKKVVVNDNGGTKVANNFSFSVNSATAVAFEADGQNNLSVSAGTYSVTEPSVTGYATTYDNCSGLVLTNGGTATCTITNDDIQPKLTVTKVVNNNHGGTKGISDFPLFVGATGVTSGTQNGFNAGNYTVSETNQAGYTGVISGNCSVNGTITLALGDEKSCTITNSDTQPQLKVVKVVTNNNGGSSVISDFTLKVGDTTVTSGSTNNFDAASYVVSESGPTGYVGTISGDCDVSGNVTLHVGDALKTCTITNDDQPGTLIIKKIVTNDDGGQATADNFTFKVNGGSATAFEADGQNDLTVNAGSYTVTEPSVAGYATTYDNCAQVSVANGGTATCTVTNDDVAPKLTLVKQITNNDGGQQVANAFTLSATGSARSFSAAGPSTGAHDVLGNTTYTLGESGPSGYTPSSWNCTGGTKDGDTINLTIGDDVTCTISNDDIAPTLKLVKIVTKDNGGNEAAGDWTLTATGTGGFSDDGDSTTFHTVKANVGYVLSESVIAGYTAASWNCTGGSLVGSTVTLGLHENVTCTITNNDEAPTITLIKEVINNNGGSATENDFGLSIDGTGVLSGAATPVAANTAIALNETGLTGYDFVSITGDKACPSVLGGTVTLSEGEDITCTIKNDDQPAHLIVIKHVDNQNLGDAIASDFQLTISDVTATGGNTFAGAESPGTNKTLTTVGAYSVGETGPEGYSASYSTDCNGTMALGETKTCTVTNTRDIGTITVNKTLVPSDDPGKFSLQIDGSTEGTGTNVGDNGTTGSITIGSGNHTTGEIAGTSTTLADYTTTYTCTDGERTVVSGTAATSDSFTVNKDQNITCTFTNTRKTGDILVHKLLRSDVDGSFVSADPGDFTWGVSELDTPYVMGSSHTFNTGGYDVYENSVANYHFFGWFEGNPEDNDFSCTNLPDSQKNFALPVSVTVTDGAQAEITLCNARDTGNLKVNKVADTDGDGKYDTTNPEAFAWGTVNADTAGYVMGTSKTLTTGSYNVYENNVPNYEFTGWFPGEPSENRFSCDNLPEGSEFTSLPTSVSVSTDQTKELTLCNKLQNPILTITKSNNAVGDQAPGGQVTFTITVEATQSAAYNVKVIDLPSQGFTYRAGSWTASSSVRGDIKGLGITTEPTYHSPGTWVLGGMSIGEIVTLTYITDISSDQKPGLYKDLALAFGCKTNAACSTGDAASVMANAINPGFVNDNHVGTNINITKEQQNGGTLNKHEGEVLGASTELPSTGADSLWLTIAAILFIAGVGLIAGGRIYRRIHV